MARSKLTPFSRILIFLIIFLPAVFFGVTYLKGEDPMATLRNWFSGDITTEQYEEAPSTSMNEPDITDKPATFENVQDLRRENKQLKDQLSIAREQLARCKAGNVE